MTNSTNHVRDRLGSLEREMRHLRDRIETVERLHQHMRAVLIAGAAIGLQHISEPAARLLLGLLR